MKLETFKLMIDLFQEDMETSSKLYDLGINTIDFCEGLYSITTLLLKSYYGTEGYDIIAWWLHDEVDHVLYDDTGTVILNDLNEVEDLWKYLEAKRKSPDFKEYDINDDAKSEPITTADLDELNEHI